MTEYIIHIDQYNADGARLGQLNTVVTSEGIDAARELARKHIRINTASQKPVKAHIHKQEPPYYQLTWVESLTD